MKTWMFVTAVFWLFYNMCVCPHSDEQMTPWNEGIFGQTPIMDLVLQTWTVPACIRPPPARTQ
jgi:hypothetical protein